MSKQQEFAEWEFLIGYPLEQAEELLKEENVAFEVIWTKAPDRASSVQEDAYVIAVRSGSPLTLVCAAPDWIVD